MVMPPAAQQTQPRPPRRVRWQVLVWVVHLSLAGIAVWHHEPWRDEADSWLLARDASLGEIWHRMGYAGTPGLWYLVLAPLAKLGLPFATQQWVHLAIASAAAAVVLWRAPWHPVLRALVVLSYYPLFEFAVVARSYALTWLLLVVLLASWQGRRERSGRFGILLALLANTNIHGMVLAAGLGAVDLLEAVHHRAARKALKGLAIAVAGGLVAVLQLLPPADGPHTVIGRTPSTWALERALGGVVLPQSDLGAQSEPTPSPDGLGGTRTLALPSLVAVLLVLAWVLRRNPRALLLVVVVWGFLLPLYTFIYYGGTRHAGILGCAVLAAAWLAALDGRGAERLGWVAAVAIGLTLLASAVIAFGSTRREIAAPFSGARDAARFLTNSGLAQHGVLIPAPDWLGVAVLPHLPITTLWYPGRRETGSFQLWDLEHHQVVTTMHPAESLARGMDHWGPRPDLVLVTNSHMPDPERYGWQLVYEGPTPWYHQPESYVIYTRLPALEESSPQAPPQPSSAGAARR